MEPASIHAMVLDVLERACSQNADVLKPAEAKLKEWETQPGFYSALFVSLLLHRVFKRIILTRKICRRYSATTVLSSTCDGWLFYTLKMVWKSIGEEIYQSKQENHFGLYLVPAGYIHDLPEIQYMWPCVQYLKLVFANSCYKLQHIQLNCSYLYNVYYCLLFLFKKCGVINCL